jgi:cyclohexa-1,5-dienecarbonyl-CoA hydratase
MIMYQHIRFQIEERIGRIRLSRPPLNVITIAMMKEISHALDECESRRDMVAIVFDAVQGSRAFSAGVAIEEHAEEIIYKMLENFHEIFRTLEQLGKPAIALVDGAALGGACELVAACDIVIASERARFGQPEIKLGVFPPVAAVLLPRIIGQKKARELLLTGELVNAREALQLGLVNHVVASSEIENKLQEIISKLRELSSAALSMTKRAMDASIGLSFNEGLKQTEKIYLNDLMKTLDAREGIKAFMEKRKPNWKHK